MKLFKTFFPVFLFSIFTFLSISIQSCKPDNGEDEEDTCDTCAMVYKPNIYIYPEEETYLDLTLEFPKGGRVVTSIPEYGNGWNVTVNTDGIIDNEFEYLFYESMQPDVWQMEKGWCIQRENLNDFFTNNLSEFGFVGREIDDFVDYWIPKFQIAEYYCIYPQIKTIVDQVIQLRISEEPDNILRLFYAIQESNSDKSNDLNPPKIESFLREGFFISEWGVVLK